MNYHKGFIAPLLLALVAILLIGGGAYVYTQTKQTNLPVAAGDATLPQATSTTQASNSQITGWRTYTDDVIGLQFQYPSTLEAPRIVDSPHTVTMGIFNITVSTASSSAQLSQNAKREHIVVGGKNATKIIFPDEPEMFKGSTSIIIPLSNRTAVINYADNGSEMNQIYEKIIKTIVFTK